MQEMETLLPHSHTEFSAHIPTRASHIATQIFTQRQQEVIISSGPTPITFFE